MTRARHAVVVAVLVAGIVCTVALMAFVAWWATVFVFGAWWPAAAVLVAPLVAVWVASWLAWRVRLADNARRAEAHVAHLPFVASPAPLGVEARPGQDLARPGRDLSTATTKEHSS